MMSSTLMISDDRFDIVTWTPLSVWPLNGVGGDGLTSAQPEPVGLYPTDLEAVQADRSIAIAESIKKIVFFIFQALFPAFGVFTSVLHVTFCISKFKEMSIFVQPATLVNLRNSFSG